MRQERLDRWFDKNQDYIEWWGDNIFKTGGIGNSKFVKDLFILANEVLNEKGSDGSKKYRN